jgi:hypothetical protein
MSVSIQPDNIAIWQIPTHETLNDGKDVALSKQEFF